MLDLPLAVHAFGAAPCGRGSRRSTSRLACRRSLRSLLPLAHPSALPGSRFTSFTVRPFGGLPPVGRPGRTARVGTFTAAPLAAPDVLTDDELAGIIDLFGALRRPELSAAVSELAYRQGSEPPDVDAAVEAARSSFVLLAVPGEEGQLLAVGPAAFPTLPDGAEDLLHILDVEPRSASDGRVTRLRPSDP